MDVIRLYTEPQKERRRGLLRLIEAEKRACAERCQPYIDELVKIDNCTPVRYILNSTDHLSVIEIPKAPVNS